MKESRYLDLNPTLTLKESIVSTQTNLGYFLLFLVIYRSILCFYDIYCVFM